MTSVLQMMKKDVQSVVGLTVEYDYGGIGPFVGVIANGRVSEYNYPIGDMTYVGKIYQISFMSSPMSYYGVYEDKVKILLNN